MQVAKIEMAFILIFCFGVGLALGAIFIDVQSNEETFPPESFFKYKTCEETLLECYISLQEFQLNYRESKNYEIDLE